MIDRLFQSGIFIEGNRYLCYLEAFYLHIFNLQHIRVCQNRIINPQHLTVFRLLFEQVALDACINSLRGNDFLADRIDWRVCNLCKQLLEVVKQRLMTLGKYGQRSVDSHCARAFSPICCHI